MYLTFTIKGKSGTYRELYSSFSVFIISRNRAKRVLLKECVPNLKEIICNLRHTRKKKSCLVPNFYISNSLEVLMLRSPIITSTQLMNHFVVQYIFCRPLQLVFAWYYLVNYWGSLIQCITFIHYWRGRTQNYYIFTWVLLIIWRELTKSGQDLMLYSRKSHQLNFLLHWIKAGKH